ncbi:MAG: phage tail sheath C-terminal domain-containing protein [Bacteroidota bacterium]
MTSDPQTPGVYIVEKNAFPGSAVAVETSVPVFIGYTQKAERNGKSLLHIPTKISSLAEYVELFGEGFHPRFKITAAAAGTKEETFLLNGKNAQIHINDNNTLYFYRAIQFFYQNGGGNCYIMPVGTYGDKPTDFEIDLIDFTGNDKKPNPFTLLEKEYEPSLVILPDIIAKGIAAYPIYQLVLAHCAKMQSRFGIFDVAQFNTQTPDDDIQQFRDGIGTDFLNYGAAYYPWLKTSVIQSQEIDFTNFDDSVDLADWLPEKEARQIVANMKALEPEALIANRVNIHQSLRASSASYGIILDAIRIKLNLLPPSAAIAGIYTLVDSSRGVWKAPANVSLSMVNSPAISISAEQQETMNVDIIGGKSINVIRPFPGLGSLVWGARTLDGNSQDWRYINVRRTMIMIEQSLKLACRAYVFEPNDSGTWITIKSMMNNFLGNLWKQGALAGAVPEQAFDVQVGLGVTMTPADILDRLLVITVKLAMVRPAEFIVLTFQQQQQQS